MRTDGLVPGIRSRDTAALARAISVVENGRPGYEDLLSELHPLLGRAHRVGITGPPGAGKSTLIERVVQAYRTRGSRVAVVAVDPTSPFSGGALLGDRIRMEALALDPDVFIRSMASRGAHGGLATTTREVCDVLDAAGFDRVLIETVGVGQAELAITGSADTTVLVLVPESGDGVQALKAGVMEIADVYVVNKADRPGADRLVQEVEIVLGIRAGNAYRHVAPHHQATPATTVRRSAGPPVRPSDGGDGEAGGWSPPVLTAVARDGTGVADLVAAIEAHQDHVSRTGRLEQARRERLLRHTRDVVDRALSALVWEERNGGATVERALEELASGRLSPYRLAHDIVADLGKGARHER